MDAEPTMKRKKNIRPCVPLHTAYEKLSDMVVKLVHWTDTRDGR